MHAVCMGVCINTKENKNTQKLRCEIGLMINGFGCNDWLDAYSFLVYICGKSN